MEYELIQYVRKNIRKNEKGLVMRGPKKGVLLATLHPENEHRVIIGFSLCSDRDRWDYVDGVHVPNFGKDVAYNRAVKLADAEVANVPRTIQSVLPYFIERSKKYFKKCLLPRWTTSYHKWNDS